MERIHHQYHHFVIYGITLDRFKLEHTLLECDPQPHARFKGYEVYWRKSKTPADDLVDPREREFFRRESGNPELLIGYVFPDGSIDRNWMRNGRLKEPLRANLGDFCYFDDAGRQTLGNLVLRHSSLRGWRSTGNPEELRKYLNSHSSELLVHSINWYGFDITPRDLEIVQLFSTTPIE